MAMKTFFLSQLRRCFISQFNGVIYRLSCRCGAGFPTASPSDHCNTSLLSLGRQRWASVTSLLWETTRYSTGYIKNSSLRCSLNTNLISCHLAWNLIVRHQKAVSVHFQQMPWRICPNRKLNQYHTHLILSNVKPFRFYSSSGFLLSSCFKTAWNCPNSQNWSLLRSVLFTVHWFNLKKQNNPTRDKSLPLYLSMNRVLYNIPARKQSSLMRSQSAGRKTQDKLGLSCLPSSHRGQGIPAVCPDLPHTVPEDCQSL